MLSSYPFLCGTVWNARSNPAQGEFVFIVSRECRDVSPSEAESYILGYTIGNDLSCRLYQMPDQAGGQFFFAKAFDKFAPLGPTLISPEIFDGGKGFNLVTRVNGKVVQEVEILKDIIFKPAQILSFMSQGMARNFCFGHD